MTDAKHVKIIKALPDIETVEKEAAIKSAIMAKGITAAEYDKMKIQIEINVLKEIIASGDYRMGKTGLMAGAHYGELKKKLKELQIEKGSSDGQR